VDDDIRIRVTDDVTVAASAVRYDAECNREVAASIRARARSARIDAQGLREENRAVRAQVAQTQRRFARNARSQRG
jgi:hypothetical protein